MLKQTISTVRLFPAPYNTKGKIKCLTNCIVPNEPAQELFYQDLFSSNIFFFTYLQTSLLSSESGRQKSHHENTPI